VPAVEAIQTKHKELATMSVIRVGSTEKYSDNWDNIFGGKKKSASKKKSVAKKSTKKTTKKATKKTKKSTRKKK